MKIALDTNILAYAEGAGDDARCAAARALIEDLAASEVLIPAQALGELHVLTAAQARRRDSAAPCSTGPMPYEVADSTWPSFQAAIDLACDHRMQIWDGLVLSVAAENRCRLLLSEDLQHGFTWRGVTVINPFEHVAHPLLLAACNSSS
ncbi:MAG: PIN domain-containing protein [Thauera sp.]|nr:PIN domain-containing protein [Thauera sp.]